MNDAVRVESPRQRERLQVDAVDAQAGLVRDLDELRIMSRWAATSRIFCSSVAVVARHRGEDLVVEDGLVDRDGDRLLGLKLDRRAKLLLVDEREGHGAHDDLLIGDPETEPLAREAAFLPERLELGREAVDIDDLALEDETPRAADGRPLPSESGSTSCP